MSRVRWNEPECARHGHNLGTVAANHLDLDSQADHTKPYPGDHGIQFEPVDPKRVGKLTGHPFLLRLRKGGS